MKKNNESKIGIFVISGLLLLIFGWAFLREVTLQKQFKFIAVFEDVSGLTKGAFVRINGLRIGRVDKLTLDIKKNKVFVESRIQLPEINIPLDSKIYIRTSGYVGDKYLDISLGMSSQILEEGGIIAGEPVFEISKIIDKLNQKELGNSIQDFTTGAANLMKNADMAVKNTDVAAKKIAVTSDEVSDALNQKFIFPKLLFGKLINSKAKKDKIDTVDKAKNQ